MAKIVVSINEVIELNQMLQGKGLPFKVHLHDACGNQSFTMEALKECNSEELVEMKQVVAQFFETIRISIRFSEDGLTFVTV
ncbi:MAG TPA: hypothetical protein VHQ24_00665 [Lachnospiraceae bacterium]|nr:hypothetical protein [Lachnospiraceae bacterium]